MTSTFKRIRQVPDGAIRNIPIKTYSIIIQLWSVAVMNQLIPIIISARKINRETTPKNSSPFPSLRSMKQRQRWCHHKRDSFVVCFSDEFIECRVENVLFLLQLFPLVALTNHSKLLGNVFFILASSQTMMIQQKKNALKTQQLKEGDLWLGFVYTFMNLVRIPTSCSAVSRWRKRNKQ